METADDAHEMLCDVSETDLNIPELCTLGTGVRLSLTRSQHLGRNGSEAGCGGRQLLTLLFHFW